MILTPQTPGPSQTCSSREKTGHIVLVDDETSLLEVLKMILERLGHEVSTHENAASGRHFIQSNPGWADIVISDLQMPGEDGLSLLTDLLKQDPGLVGMVLTGFGSTDNAVQAMRIGVFDFITKPLKMEAVRAAVERGMRHRGILLENQNYQRHMETLVEERGRELRQALGKLDQAYQFTLESLVALLEAREKATGEHSLRVTAMARTLARFLGLDEVECETVARGAFLHDIGKVAIPDAILLKPGKLDPEEWEVMKTHAAIGYSILRKNPQMEDIAEIVHSHHEHYDGSGYPKGLKGEEIRIGARIFAVVDAYDAIRSPRPYAKARSSEEALREIQRCSGSQFDPKVVSALIAIAPEMAAIWDEYASSGGKRLSSPDSRQEGYTNRS